MFRVESDWDQQVRKGLMLGDLLVYTDYFTTTTINRSQATIRKSVEVSGSHP